MSRPESVFTIAIEQNKEGSRSILLVKRRDIPVWVLPGGGIEEGESAEDAALREFEEETGLKGKIVRQVALYTPENKMSKVTAVFTIEVKGGQLETTTETADCRFFYENDLPVMPPPFHSFIQDALANKKEMIVRQITGTSYRALAYHMLRHPVLVIRFLLTKLGIHLN